MKKIAAFIIILILADFLLIIWGQSYFSRERYYRDGISPDKIEKIMEEIEKEREEIPLSTPEDSDFRALKKGGSLKKNFPARRSPFHFL